MTGSKINSKLIKKLQSLLSGSQICQLIEKYQRQNQLSSTLSNLTSLKDEKNETTAKPKRLSSQSKQKRILRKQSKTTLREQAIVTRSQAVGQTARESESQVAKKLIKDKAVFMNVNQLPYLHSTDLLSHLYKKSSHLTEQTQSETPLYNPPLNNPHVLTKVKHLHIYYCKVESLRDMGTGWSNLIQLSVYFGKLRDLSGLNAFPSLQYLHCPFNSISTLSDLMFHPTLISIDLEFNQISDFNEVEHLFTVENLEYINLLNNPVYSNKETRRKINEKFEKIIESENTRIEEYLGEKERQIWQIQHMQGVQYCNHLLKQFYEESKKDQITLEAKYRHCNQNEEHNELNFEAFTTNFNASTAEQNDKSAQKELRIQYIPPQIPQNAYFEELIMNGSSEIETEAGGFCEQKIYLTPLTQMIDQNKIFIGPVLDKYLNNKLYIREDLPREKSRLLKQTISIEQQQKSENPKSKLKKISKLSLTGFTNKQNSQTPYQSTVASNFEETDLQMETPSEFGKTSTSLSTNCTALNNTSTNFAFRRTRPSLSKSKEKSLTKTSLLSKLTQNIAQTQKINEIGLNTHQMHSTTLVKQSRLLMGKSLKKDGIESNVSNQKDLEEDKNKEISLEKTSFSTALKRKATLSSSKKERSSILKRGLQV